MLDVDELKLLEKTTASVLTSTDVVAELREQGWFELWADEPAAAARALFGQQGRLARSSPMLTLLIGAALTGRDDEPALLPHRDGPLGQLDALTGAPTALLPGSTGLRRVSTADLQSTEIHGLDPDLRLCRVQPPNNGETVEGDWPAALALGRRLLAEELRGVVAEQLRLALEHAHARSQFGRPIGAFQAVQHLLADVQVALTVAELAADEAWATPNPTTSLLAKMLAGAAMETANRNCQQVLGGIGFTWEHPFHRYLRRGRLLDALLGSRAELAAALGAEILHSREVPDLAPLQPVH